VRGFPACVRRSVPETPRRSIGTPSRGDGRDRELVHALVHGLRGAVHPHSAPALAHLDPEVMFQRIVYDGPLGDAFLRRFAVTYDVDGSRMIFG
jgi:hypothetical protein